jgi:hypothetical protein
MTGLTEADWASARNCINTICVNNAILSKVYIFPTIELLFGDITNPIAIQKIFEWADYSVLKTDVCSQFDVELGDYILRSYVFESDIDHRAL